MARTPNILLLAHTIHHMPPTPLQKIQQHRDKLCADLLSKAGFWQNTEEFNTLKQQKIHGLNELAVVLNQHNANRTDNPNSVASAQLLRRLEAIKTQYPLLLEGTFSECRDLFTTVQKSIESAVLSEARMAIEYTGALAPMAHTTAAGVSLSL